MTKVVKYNKLGNIDSVSYEVQTYSDGRWANTTQCRVYEAAQREYWSRVGTVVTVIEETSE